MKPRWESPTLTIHHGSMALFLAWNDDTGEVLFMNSDKLEWFWSTLEFVGTANVGTYSTPGEAGQALWFFAHELERGVLGVTRSTHDGPNTRDLHRWTGETWDDPMDEATQDSRSSFDRWQQRRAALGSLSAGEVAELIRTLGTS
jgi:hypothetical protein